MALALMSSSSCARSSTTVTLRAGTLERMTDRPKIALVTGGSRGHRRSHGGDAGRSGVGRRRLLPRARRCRRGRRRRMPRARGGALSPCAPTWLRPPTSPACSLQVDRELGPLTGLVNNAGIVPSGGVRRRLHRGAAGDALRHQRHRRVPGRPRGGAAHVDRARRQRGRDREHLLAGSGPRRLRRVRGLRGKQGSRSTRMTIGLAREVAEEGIRVVGVRPGADRDRDPRAGTTRAARVRHRRWDAPAIRRRWPTPSPG